MPKLKSSGNEIMFAKLKLILRIIIKKMVMINPESNVNKQNNTLDFFLKIKSKKTIKKMDEIIKAFKNDSTTTCPAFS